MDFSNYRLSDLNDPFDLGDLADGLFWDMCDTIGFDPRDLGVDAFQAFVAAFGSNKVLGLNLEVVKERLGESGIQKAADWVERSGALLSVPGGAFVDPSGVPLPEQVDAAIYPDGVTRWMLRRTATTNGLGSDAFVQGLFLPFGNGMAGAGEHDLIKDFMALHDGRQLKRYEVGKTFIVPELIKNGFDPRKVHLLPMELNDGDTLAELFWWRHQHLLKGTVLIVSNAPAAVFTAGQFRHAARQVNPAFDQNGDQLFVVADGIEVARNGEGAATHQNPITALGTLARNYLFLRFAMGNL